MRCLTTSRAGWPHAAKAAVRQQAELAGSTQNLAYEAGNPARGGCTQRTRCAAASVPPAAEKLAASKLIKSYLRAAIYLCECAAKAKPTTLLHFSKKQKEASTG